MKCLAGLERKGDPVPLVERDDGFSTAYSGSGGVQAEPRHLSPTPLGRRYGGAQHRIREHPDHLGETLIHRLSTGELIMPTGHIVVRPRRFTAHRPPVAVSTGQVSPRLPPDWERHAGRVSQLNLI